MTGRPVIVAVADANAIDVESRPSRTAQADQPNRLSACPARRLGDRCLS
jgi:hypothetical protein